MRGLILTLILDVFFITFGAACGFTSGVYVFNKIVKVTPNHMNQCYSLCGESGLESVQFDKCNCKDKSSHDFEF